jgi:transglutaminase-like putative cysteine protease
MIFEILHRTDYRYSLPASEAYLEMRLTPPTTGAQEILDHQLEIVPASEISEYVDHFGNRTSFFSMTLRHEKLVISNRLKVRTQALALPEELLAVPVADFRQLLRASLPDVYEYLQPTEVVPVGGVAREWSTEWLRADFSLGQALSGLNEAIFRRFRYEPGTTTNDTPLVQVWKEKRGVCQDFAHIMLSVLRTGGIPCRYVCGYIETHPPAEGGEALVGSVATHAWVEALLPGGSWIALDPTNHCYCGEQHITVAYGRDFSEAAPVKGTFKTSGSQTMKVKVQMKRLPDPEKK